MDLDCQSNQTGNHLAHMLGTLFKLKEISVFNNTDMKQGDEFTDPFSSFSGYLAKPPLILLYG